MTPGWYVVLQGGVGEVRRWRLTPGISVIRFSSLPIKEAILRASSVLDPRAAFVFGERHLLWCFSWSVTCKVPLSKDGRLAATMPLIFRLTGGIGNK
jgi:hypothetical protein